MDGRSLHFRLAGINNQNFLMRDEETGSIWQQVSGKSIWGPLKGRTLPSVYFEELTFKQWFKEKPHGRILKPDNNISASSKYAKENWEQQIARLPVVTNLDGILPPREIIIGVQIGGLSKAYPLNKLSSKAPINDRLGETLILLCMAKDGKSVRCFDRTLDGNKLEIFAKHESDDLTLIDSTTNSEWGFDGIARSGPLAGRQLTRIPAIKDYWFDWKIYHPKTLLYRH